MHTDWYKWTRGAILLALILWLVGFGVRPAFSAPEASFTVNNNGDQPDAAPGDGACRTAGGQCTLRAAIDEANQLSGPNTVVIPAMTIVINTELRIPNHSGNDSLVILGAGIDRTVIDGNNRTRVFYFAHSSGTHSVSDLTIRNANNQNTSAGERYGGGIFNEAFLTLTNVKVLGSKAYEGGGVHNHLATGSNVPSLTLNNVIMGYNAATSTDGGIGGGGLFNGATLNGNNVTIVYNTAAMQGAGFYNNSYYPARLTNFAISHNTAKFAGGINNDLGDITLISGVIGYNIANCCDPNGKATGGAGIYNNNGAMHLTNVSVTNNVATSSGGYGGGIHNSERMDLTNVSVTFNQATYGAGIYNGNYYGATNQLTGTNVTLSGNLGLSSGITSEGGALFNTERGHIRLTNTTVSQNSSQFVGGILNYSSNNTQIELENTILSGNTDTAGAPDCGGAIQSLGYNLVKDFDGSSLRRCTWQTTPSKPDQLGVVPSLMPLTGSPAYHPLMPSSLAIDRGANMVCPRVDIAGNTRPFGGSCDVGSYEWNMPLVLGDKRVYLPLTVR